MDANCQTIDPFTYMIPFLPVHRQGSCVSNNNKDRAGSDFLPFLRFFQEFMQELQIFTELKVASWFGDVDAFAPRI